MTRIRRHKTTLRTRMACSFFLLIFGSALGEKIYGPPPDPEIVASILLGHYDFVADGEFYDLPESTEEELKALKHENLLVKFRIEKLYKPEGHLLDSIDVQLASDMLVYPGEGTSLYAKKQSILDKQREDVHILVNQSRANESLFEADDIDYSEYISKRSKILDLVRERKRRDGLADHHTVTIIDGESFYDRGGVIKLGQKYLLAANEHPERAQVYFLDESQVYSISYWGKERQDLLSILADLTR